MHYPNFIYALPIVGAKAYQTLKIKMMIMDFRRFIYEMEPSISSSLSPFSSVSEVSFIFLVRMGDGILPKNIV